MRRVRVFFAWFDMWIGAYVDTNKKVVYICPLPMLVIAIQYGKEIKDGRALPQITDQVEQSRDK